MVNWSMIIVTMSASGMICLARKFLSTIIVRLWYYTLYRTMRTVVYDHPAMQNYLRVRISIIMTVTWISGRICRIIVGRVVFTCV